MSHLINSTQDQRVAHNEQDDISSRLSLTKSPLMLSVKIADRSPVLEVAGS